MSDSDHHTTIIAASGDFAMDATQANDQSTTTPTSFIQRS